VMLQSSGKTALETGTVYEFKKLFIFVHCVLANILRSCYIVFMKSVSKS
jgi:hypothetical protein